MRTAFLARAALALTLAFGTASVVLSLPAHAQFGGISGLGANTGVRKLPEDAKWGTLTFLPSFATAVIDEKYYGLAGGLVVRDQNNLIITSGTVPANTKVRYQLDADSKVSRVWVLSQAEIEAAPKPVPLPTPKPGDGVTSDPNKPPPAQPEQPPKVLD